MDKPVAKRKKPRVKFINSVMIKNYEYEIISGKKLLAGAGFVDYNQIFDSPVSIGEFNKNFKIYYDGLEFLSLT